MDAANQVLLYTKRQSRSGTIGALEENSRYVGIIMVMAEFACTSIVLNVHSSHAMSICILSDTK